MYQKILIPIDGSGCSERAARVGFALAKGVGSKVVLTYVMDNWPPRASHQAQEGWEEAKAEGKALLETWKLVGQDQGLAAETHFVELSAPAEGIVKVAKEEACDLVVMGTHSREGLAHLLLGSVAERVTRLSPVPVMLVHGKDGMGESFEFERILVAMDGSRLSRMALEHAQKLVGYTGGRLYVLHVVPKVRLHLHEPQWAYQAQQLELRHEGAYILDEATKDFPNAEAILREAGTERIGEVISQVAHEKGADLIVLGTHGRSGLEHLLLGSVAEHVAHRSGVNVLLVRQT